MIPVHYMKATTPAIGHVTRERAEELIRMGKAQATYRFKALRLLRHVSPALVDLHGHPPIVAVSRP